MKGIYEVLFMSFNPFKLFIQTIQERFARNISKYKQRNDEETECIQFAICSVQVRSPRSEELFFR